MMDATATIVTDTPCWTIAIRPTETRGIFHRVDLALTWSQAVDLAGYVHTLTPEAAVWYVPNRQAELTGYVHTDDVLNVMVHTGARIRIKDDGVLPFDTNPPACTAVTSLNDLTDEVGRVVDAMRTHKLGQLVEFDALGVHYRTKITRDKRTLARVETRPTDGANLEAVVTIEINLGLNGRGFTSEHRIPTAKMFLLVSGAGGELIQDSDDYNVVLATALVHLRHVPATVRRIECWN
jgi:hypothetical protein